MWVFFKVVFFIFSTFCFFTFPSVPRRLTEKIPRCFSCAQVRFWSQAKWGKRRVGRGEVRGLVSQVKASS